VVVDLSRGRGGSSSTAVACGSRIVAVAEASSTSGNEASQHVIAVPPASRV
jgi:hypothetical protein